MKKILIFFILIPLLGFSKIDTTFNTQKEAISIYQEGINDLLSKYKRILLERNGVDGWRLQIKFKSKREDILPYQVKFTKLYPEIPAQITFDSPYYKLTVGNFRTKNEALKTKHKISKNFPGAHPVPVIIDSDLFKH